MAKTFKDLKLENTYSSLSVDLVKDVVSPLLVKSVRYDRGVGFFTSGWLKEAANGLLEFVQNNGKARIITSPILSTKDWETIKKADEEAQENLIIRYSLERTIKELEEKLELDTLAALAWLVHDYILEFRFAVPTKNLSGGDFHSKLSLFYDQEGNGIALHGSQNDSTKASLNEETLSVFCSWDEGNKWFKGHQEWFENIWNDNYSNLNTYIVKEAEKFIITQHADKLPRPYPPLSSNSSSPSPPSHPSMNPKITLRNYQEEAIAKWLENDKRGIFEMATGAGKTITAIAAAVRTYEDTGRIAVVILVPYIHLVDQWLEELSSFCFSPIPCYQSVNKWKDKVANAVREYNAGLTKHICLVSTHDTASAPSQVFLKLIKRIFPPCLLIGDEIHGLGAANYRKALTEHATWRIGLSATPDRWHDEEGTNVLREYFGKTVINYDLDRAIKEDALTSYLYYPEKINLTGEEAEEYNRLSNLIAQLAGAKDSGNQEMLDGLRRKRADIVGKAYEKLPRLLNMIRVHREEAENNNEKFKHILIYCNKGTHNDVLQHVNDLGIKAHEFVHEVSLKNRRKVLDAFTKGQIEALIAIRCLDEGVDVPATRRAYILASSTNPREFVQRRGRILRKSPGKQFAVVHDFIVGPWEEETILSKNSSESLIIRELPRFAEFSLGARNAQEARDAIWDTVERLNLVPYLRKKPWEVYREIKLKEKGNVYG